MDLSSPMSKEENQTEPSLTKSHQRLIVTSCNDLLLHMAGHQTIFTDLSQFSNLASSKELSKLSHITFKHGENVKFAKVYMKSNISPQVPAVRCLYPLLLSCYSLQLEMQKKSLAKALSSVKCFPFKLRLRQQIRFTNTNKQTH